jgi:4-diphosphocytidyl-2-C-methyl-D-erythritol kinase
MSQPTSSLVLAAPAKINLWLRILGKRDDGFHTVETRMCPLSIADKVTIEALPAGESSRLTCSDASLPVDESNLALKALRAFEGRTGILRGWHVHLDKHIPSGAGLGGGSSDAAAVLRGLNELTGIPLSVDELCTIAGAIGSDIPFFIHGRVCDATGRGEIVAPAEFPHSLTVLLIKPPFPIPTPWAYKNWSSSTEIPGIRYTVQACPWGEMVNDLERPVFQKHLLLPTLKMWLLDQPETRAALMSGSGSTMFAIVDDEAAGQALARRTQDWCGDTTWIRLSHTVATDG